MATWWDHYQLHFWLWAVLRNGKVYLEVSAIFESMMQRDVVGESFDACRREMKLAEYHFVATMGKLIRILKKSPFPAIQEAYSRATQLSSEGIDLRHIIEHDNEYFAGGGQQPAKWERRNAPIQGVVVDASSTYVNEKGHWLGGRLNVEDVIQEVEAIEQEARKIPAPTASQ